jgi:superoxide dismutase, Cu-Zn family
MSRRMIAIGSAAVAAAVAGTLVFAYPATAHYAQFRADLRDPSGRTVGTVHFRISHHDMQVDARLRPNRYVEAGAFHGFHVHANNDDANGTGCQADPGAASATWFVSADGHLANTDPSDPAQTHGAHDGDLPSPLVLEDGTARLAFTTDRIEPEDLKGRAVILHALPDNFGNVPVGGAPNQYTANSAAATDLTSRTGNASDRVACGLVRRSR